MRHGITGSTKTCEWCSVFFVFVLDVYKQYSFVYVFLRKAALKSIVFFFLIDVKGGGISMAHVVAFI